MRKEVVFDLPANKKWVKDFYYLSKSRMFSLGTSSRFYLKHFKVLYNKVVKIVGNTLQER